MNSPRSFRRWDVDPKIGVLYSFCHIPHLSWSYHLIFYTNRESSGFLFFIYRVCVMNLLFSRHWVLLSLACGKTRTQKTLKNGPFLSIGHFSSFCRIATWRQRQWRNLGICLAHHLDQISQYIIQPIAPLESCTNSNFKKIDFFEC